VLPARACPARPASCCASAAVASAVHSVTAAMHIDNRVTHEVFTPSFENYLQRQLFGDRVTHKASSTQSDEGCMRRQLFCDLHITPCSA
jgi:hypothetical protein